MTHPAYLIPFALLLTLAGCQVPSQSSGSPAPEAQSQISEPRVKSVAAPAHCGLTAPGLVLAQSAEDWQRLTSEPNVQLPEWPKTGDTYLLVVTTGQKYTGGYSLALDGFEWPDRTLRLNVSQKKPAQGTMTTQVLTTPCVVLSIPQDGWDSLIVAGESPFPIIRIHP
jgi:hypothetical protein